MEVQLWAKLVDVGQEMVFSKDIFLTRETYDMLEGEAMVQLRSLADYPYSCCNELFELVYWFKVVPCFEDE